MRFTSALPSLIDRLGDSKDQVREQDQALLLKIMDQAANPQVHNKTAKSPQRQQDSSWGLCVCLSAVRVGEDDRRFQAQEQPNQRRTLPVPHLYFECVRLSKTTLGYTRPYISHRRPMFSSAFCGPRFGSQSLTLSKIVPHICNLLGDPTSQVTHTSTSATALTLPSCVFLNVCKQTPV